MSEQILEAIEQKDYQILAEYLAKVPFYRQAKAILEWTEYQQLLNRIKYIKLQQNRMYEIKQKIFYVMLGTGYATSKKNRSFIAQQPHHQKFQGILSKGRKQTKIIPSDLKQLRCFDSFDLYSFFHGYYLSKFIFTKNNESFLLKLEVGKIQENVFNRLRQNHLEKIRFLLSFEIFQKIEKQKLQQQIGCFQTDIYSFEELIYDENQNYSKVFFLQVGEVKVTYPGNTSGCINSAPKMLGFNKNLINEKVKCVSDHCKVISIQRNQLNRLLRQTETRQNNKENESLDEDLFKPSSYQNRVNPSYRILKTAGGGIQSSQQNLFRTNKSSSKLQPGKISKLKCYFSNNLNDNFHNFSEKRLELINKTRQMQENQVFYKIKCLVPHLPVMNDINKKLKQVRESKYNKIKQHIMKTKDQSILAKTEYLQSNQSQRQKINQYVNKFLKKKKKQQKQYGIVRKNSFLKYDSL